MTPIWRKAIRANLAVKSGLPALPMTTQALVAARCFDMREVEEHCVQISGEMLEATLGDSYISPSLHEVTLDLGAAACVPAPLTWLEFSDFAVIISAGDVLYSGPFHAFADPKSLFGLIIMKPRLDEFESGVGRALVEFEGGLVTIKTKRTDGGVATIRGIALALGGIALINSRAAVREPIEAHSGVARTLSGRGFKVDRSIVHTKVSIGRLAHGPGTSGAITHPRAYHFCRAHTRSARGRVQQVRAHWRGDPAFGVRLPTYNVKPALIEGGAS